MTARLAKILTEAGIRVAVLKARVATDKREAWYRQQLKRGVQVVICHPKLVETGLDLLECPTILFYESGYSLHTLRQGSRRSWRIGQHLPVRVKFLCYEETMQTRCLQLMGKKLLTALMLEGKFCGEGLQDIDGAEDSDMLAAMARTLTEGGIGESADQIWRTLSQEHQKTSSAVTAASPMSNGEAEESVLSAGPLEVPPLLPSLEGPFGSRQPVLVFGQAVASLRTARRRARPVIEEQGSLFG